MTPRAVRRARMHPRRAAAALALMLVAGAASGFDLQGHRGARGLAPENTLAAFELALKLGVDTIESDLAVTRDGLLVLAHHPQGFTSVARVLSGNAASQRLFEAAGYHGGPLQYRKTVGPRATPEQTAP